MARKTKYTPFRSWLRGNYQVEQIDLLRIDKLSDKELQALNDFCRFCGNGSGGEWKVVDGVYRGLVLLNKQLHQGIQLSQADIDRIVKSSADNFNNFFGFYSNSYFTF